MTQAVLDFSGNTYDAERDGARLTGQCLRVWEFMKGGQWRTLTEIARACQCSQTSASARLRDFRKPQFGEHEVERSYVGEGLWRYRVRA